jgi:hypothetical protein
MLRAFCLVCFLATAARLPAQPSQNSLPNQQRTSYEAKFKNLMGSRGLPHEAEEVNETHGADVIGRHGPQTTGNGPPFNISGFPSACRPLPIYNRSVYESTQSRLRQHRG